MISQLVLLMVLGILIAGAAAPFGALRWWSAQDPAVQAREFQAVRSRAALPAQAGEDHMRAWVVYLTGVGAVSKIANSVGERPMLDDLAAALPDVGIVSEVYPYDVGNRGLLQERTTAWFWRLVEWLAQSRWFRLARALVYLRNVWQFAVSADDRYGPLYSLAVAEVVRRELRAAGYDEATRRPVVLFGWSGGAQIAVAVAAYLGLLGIPLYVVSLGGVITSDPGLERVRHLWHLTGSKDHVQAIGGLFPGRWPGRRDSYWARAVADGRVSRIEIGDQRHLGRGSYLSRAHMPDGRRYRDVSVAEVAARVEDAIAREQAALEG